nr:hypothetical protein [Acetobacter persici]
MKNNSVTPALVVLVVDVALGVAFVLLPPVVMGFLMLLKDVFGVLILPFSFLFGLAGWSSDMSSLDSVMGGLTPSMLRHPFRAITAAAFIAVGGLCSVLACSSPRAAHAERIVAPILTLAAIGLWVWRLVWSCCLRCCSSFPHCATRKWISFHAGNKCDFPILRVLSLLS